MGWGTKQKQSLEESKIVNWKMRKAITNIRRLGARYNSGWPLSAVGVDRRFEFLDSTVGANIFNAVTEGSFVK